MQSEAFNRQLGEDIEAAEKAGMSLDHYTTKMDMAKLGLAWTRANFIDFNRLPDGELPEGWDESDLPEDLQD